MASALAYLHRGTAKLVSRNGRFKSWPALCAAVARALRARSAVLDGDDLRDRPLVERKRMLCRLIPRRLGRLRYVDHVVGDGVERTAAAHPTRSAGSRV